MNEAYKEAVESAEKLVKQMQEFDPSSIARVPQLGEELSFVATVPAAERLVGLYKRLSVRVLSELTMEQLGEIQGCTEQNYQFLEQILQFKVRDHDHPANQRDALDQQVQNAFGGTCNVLMPYICLGLSGRMVDFQKLEQEASKAKIQMEENFSQYQTDMDEQREKAKTIVESIRNAAGEAGVSQQETAFWEEAVRHQRLTWFWGAGVVALATYFLAFIFTGDALLFGGVEEKSSDLMTKYAIVKAVTNRVLVVGVFSFGLFFCVKNYLAHSHNVVVNRHRQNALKTYQALMKASGEDSESKNVILAYAARCIYGPQDSGYVRGGGADGGGVPIYESARRAAANLVKNPDKGD